MIRKLCAPLDFVDHQELVPSQDGAIPAPQGDGEEKTLALTVAYNGQPFSGFARQEGRSTVQGELEQALALLYRRPVETVCAGRTDAGVHALGQVVSFSLSGDELEQRSFDSLRRSLNAITHPLIAIRNIEERPAGFSARFDAKSREYHYHLATGPVPPIFLRDFTWYIRDELDVSAMERASRYLIGEHDFKSFCVAASAVGKPTRRYVEDIRFVPETHLGEEVVTMVVQGNAFLHSMVRTMMGTLVAVGRGKRPASWVPDVLAAQTREAAGETAPARGLVLWSVVY